MRLNRFLAASGLGSRRSCEDLILGGSVTINGQICQNLATDVSEEDFVKIGSRRILPEKPFYVLLHKPRGYLCTATDTHGRQTIFDLVPAHWPRLFHVGRLDKDSEGLLILTNDGDLALHLTHPRYRTEKEYEVLLDRPYDAAKSTPKLLRGVSTEEGRAKAESVRQISAMLLRVVLRQGLKRQIRVMLYKAGYEVKRLIRIRIGSLRLTELRAGEWRLLTPDEVKALRTERPPSPPVIQKGPVRPVKAPIRPIKAPKSPKAPGKPELRPAGKKVRSAGREKPARRPDVSRPEGGHRQPPSRTKFSRRGSASSAPRAGRRP
jgi:23S rRNA pseudouridine2605 synthase